MAYRSRQRQPPQSSTAAEDVPTDVAQEIARNFGIRTHHVEVVGKDVHMFFRKPCDVDLGKLPKERGGMTFHYELS